ncbi:MAG: radical SAM protein, partial [Gemmatimonadota bacterium]
TSCFLQDGDSFLMKTADLLQVLEHIRRRFPSLQRITSYGRAATMVRKPPEEMRALCQAGLNRLYCGMESGSDRVLERIHKGVTAADIVRAGLMAREAGMEISEFLIVGLGGRELAEENATRTAAALNQIDPDFIRVRTIGVKVGSRLEQTMGRGEYVLQGEEELIREQRLLLQGLEGVTGYYSNDHAVNLLMEVEGRLMEAKPWLLAQLDQFLEMSPEEKVHFALGRRLNYYGRIGDMVDSERRDLVARQVAEIQRRYPGRADEICHYLREQVV